MGWGVSARAALPRGETFIRLKAWETLSKSLQHHLKICQQVMRKGYGLGMLEVGHPGDDGIDIFRSLLPGGLP